jgi:DNA-binding transcriptional MerR regulator
MAADPLMPIGRFARSCRLSVKALRHYDELGLLVPAHVDVATGYRYYARSQARAAVMIGMLRSLDLALPLIHRALAAGPEELRELLARESLRQEQEIARRRQALACLEHITRQGELAASDVRLRMEQTRTVLAQATTTTTEGLIPDTTALVYALLERARALAIPIDQPVLTINDFRRGEDRVDLLACIPIDEDTERSDALGDASIRLLEPATLACLDHVGPYETLGLAHHALHAWAQERGHEPQGPIWEYYIDDPADVAPEQLRTEVALPLVTDEG